MWHHHHWVGEETCQNLEAKKHVKQVTDDFAVANVDICCKTSFLLPKSPLFTPYAAPAIEVEASQLKS